MPNRSASETKDGKVLSRKFLEKICALPDGGRIKECLQCGTCSASCPTSGAMEYSPREIIAALRAGMLDQALRSNAVWLCASCYMCAVRCPAGIPFTDVMYELKRLGIEEGIYPRDSTNAIMAQAFVEVVDRHGLNSESELIRKFYLRTKPFRIFAQVPFAARLFFKGRLAMRPHKIKGLERLRKMMAAVDEDGSQ